MLPRARGQRRVAVLQIHLGDLQIHGRLMAGFVLGVEEAQGVGLVFRAQAGLLAGGGVLGVKYAGTLKQNIPILHVMPFWFSSVNQTSIAVLAVSYRVLVKFGKILAGGESSRSFTDSFTDTCPMKLRKLLDICHLKVEPVVGLEPTTCSLRMSCSTTELNWRKRKKTLPTAMPHVKHGLNWNGSAHGNRTRLHELRIRCPSR